MPDWLRPFGRSRPPLSDAHEQPRVGEPRELSVPDMPGKSSQDAPNPADHRGGGPPFTVLPPGGLQDPGPGEDPDSDSGGVHAILKRTNYWFEREVHVLERDARASAEEWAHKGLPRHDVPRTEPLEPEQVLAKRCAQLFRDWQLRVKTKMQDAIADGGRQLAEHVSRLRAKVSRLETIAHELAERELRIERLRSEAEKDDRPVRYSALIPHWGFWLGAIALGAVEYMANFPVFRLLLPMNAALAKVATEIADAVSTDSLGAGLLMLVTDWATHIEAVVVAMVAVIVLVVLGKFVGRSSRAWFAIRAEDFPTAAKTIQQHQREHRAKAIASVVGLLCVLGFLYFSRGDIAGLAAERVRQDRAAVTMAEQRLAEARAAKNNAEIQQRIIELMELRDVLRKHEEDERYASTVQRNNKPIFLLNLALIITAAVLGYAAAHTDLTEKRGEHPDLVRLREKCGELRGEQITIDHDARAAFAQAHLAAARVRHLVSAHPLRGWESKVRRLESVIPLFRGENARLRGLDPANILAFKSEPVLDLPHIAQLDLVEPPEFARLHDELNELGLVHARLAPRGTRLDAVAAD